MIRSEIVNTTKNMKITMIQVINYLIRNMINNMTDNVMIDLLYKLVP